MAAPWWSSTVMETFTRCWADLKPGGRKAECSGLLPLYTQKSSQKSSLQRVTSRL